jgi:hypothetical protein
MTASRNVESVQHAREEEFYELHDRLVTALSKFGKHGTSESDDFWVPVDVDYYRDVFVVLARRSLICSEIISEIRSALASCRFIWVIVLHLATHDRKLDIRVLELTQSELVCYEPEFEALRNVDIKRSQH